MEDGKINWFYGLIVLLFAGMLFVSMKYFRGSGHSSVGITSARQYKISSEKSALIKSVSVVPGQQIKAGDLLIELISYESDIEIDKLTNRITALRSDLSEKAKLANSEIAYTKADQGIDIEKINSDIVQAEGEMKLNRQLTKTYSTNGDSLRVIDPMQMKVNALRQQKARHQESVSIKIKDILQKSATEQRLLLNQIQLLERELDLYINERKKLNKYSTYEGVVDNVFVKEGEQVDSYTPLLSINPVHPTTVVGYMVGKKEELPVGASVAVISYEHKHIAVSGKVIGYGSVVQLPEILQKSTAVKAFGREVFIEIDAQNGLATGEKVLIR